MMTEKLKETSLLGKRILVTGGTTGIGRATVALLAKTHGARVLTFGRHEAELKDSLDNASGGACGVLGLTADVATPEGLEAVFEAVDQQLGGLDILINNAGLSADAIKDMSPEEWRYVVETNFTAYLACAQKAVQRMSKQGGGHVVFIGSISAEFKSPESSVYSATKAGIEAFAETLRKEVMEDNIKVTTIVPGSVGADMQEMSPEEQREKIAAKEMLYAEELADTIAYVLTRSARTNIVTLRAEPLIQHRG